MATRPFGPWYSLAPSCYELSPPTSTARVAACKALPTDAEIEQSGLRDAGSFLEDMRDNRPAEYDQFIKNRATEWGSSPPQPMARCIDHFMSVCIRAIEVSAGGGGASELTEKGAVAFFRGFQT